MNYKETTEYLFSAMPSFQNVGSDAYKPGLERIEAFCAELGNPERKYITIHIAGTNGKGSTSNMLASVLRSAGLRVGLFTSPHLLDFRERMRVNGEVIPEEEVVDFVAENRDAMESLRLSFFEMTAAMAFDFFARSQVDVAVIECGLGGRLDATNIVVPALSVITNIGLEHTQYLGDTVEKIASEKGGIIKPNVPVVIGEHIEKCDAIFRDIAAEKGSSISFAQDLFSVVKSAQTTDALDVTVERLSGEQSDFRLDLTGEYQLKNVVTLLAAVESLNSMDQLDFTISEEAVRAGLGSVTEQMHLCGRWQKLGVEPLTICDTGHNLHGMQAVTTQLKQQNFRILFAVLGFARDKDLRHILPLFPINTHFIFTRPKVERAFSTAEIAEVARSLGLNFECVEDVCDAWGYAQKLAKVDDMIFIGGSNFVVSEIIYTC